MNFLKLCFTCLLLLHSNIYAQHNGLEHVSVQLEWKHQFEFAGLYAALKKGYYREAGLDVELREYQPGKSVITEVLSGNSTYGISSSQLILERLSGKKIVLLASYLKQNALVLITKPGIRSIEDLRGKKVMATRHELKNTSLAAMLHEHNLNLSDIEVVPHSFNIEAFSNGEVDAMTAFVTNQPFLLDQKNIPYKIYNPSQDGIYSYDVELFTSEQETREQPLRTKKFVEATHKGWEYALSHKEEIVELIYQEYTKEKSKKALLYEAKMIEKLMKTDLFKIGAIVPELINLNTKMYVHLGMVSKQWDLEGFVFDSTPGKIDLTANEEAFIKEHPVIRFSDVQWEPFASIQGSTYSGIFQAYYKLIEQRTGLKFEFVKIGDGINFQTVLDALKTKKIDMIDGSGKTKERQKYALFSGPLMQVSLAIVSHKQNRFNNMESLKGKRIAVAKGSTASEYMKEHFPDLHLVYTNSINEALDLVVNQQADATLDNLVVLDHMIKNNDYNHYVEISGISDYKFDIYGLIRDDYVLLHQIMNKAVKSVTHKELLTINNKLLQSTFTQSNPKTSLFTSKEKTYLKQKKELTLCVDPNWMPFEAIEDGKHVGMSTDYIDMIKSQINIPIKLIPTKTWSESLRNSSSRVCDILSLAMETPSRNAYLNFTRPYMHVPLVIATTNEKLFIMNMKELNGKKVAIVKGYALTELLKEKYPDILFIETDTATQGLKEVQSGEAYGFIDNLSTLGYQIQKHFSGTIKIAGRLDETLDLSIGVRNDEPILLDILNKTLSTIDQKSKETIYNRWVSIKFEQAFNYKLLWSTLLPLLVIILILIVRQLLLKSYNRRLQKEIADNITNLRKKDEILLQKYRMAAMGEVLSLIAHQWHQPLAAINSTISGIKLKMQSNKLKLDDSDEHKDFLTFLERKHNNILRYVKYLSKTTDDFRNFFNPNKKMEMDLLTSPIENALSIFSMTTEEYKINIIKDYQSNCPLALYHNEIMQVILNLLKNSADVLIQRNIQHPTITIHTQVNDHICLIRLCDNGQGIPETIMDKIFDPYFTTKDEKNGAGLGLYMSKIIVEQHHHGQLMVSSTQEGVCFEIILPQKE